MPLFPSVFGSPLATVNEYIFLVFIHQNLHENYIMGSKRDIKGKNGKKRKWMIVSEREKKQKNENCHIHNRVAKVRRMELKYR